MCETNKYENTHFDPLIRRFAPPSPGGRRIFWAKIRCLYPAGLEIESDSFFKKNLHLPHNMIKIKYSRLKRSKHDESIVGL
jgi:hypothetical protein